ncbi:MAG: gliding motility-associated C-terminal domain-containing protein [Chitinophagales bacterium]
MKFTSTTKLFTWLSFFVYILFSCERIYAQSESNPTTSEEKIIIPNAFSPNNDGMNDQFRIFVASDVFVENFIILNRYGQIVFEAENGASAWDGRHRGINCPEGSFFYLVSYYVAGDGGIQSRKGTVTLLR